ncbi:hypothetical protein VTH8203_03954 [Vibrio thalassae]|uniref:AP2 domain protein n=1 Tax=Vibrio thalassae TaxID=1243014 RepID=A0A240EQ90_9VIBR|nr:Fe3+-citrate ABC transporter substrate-binding protein [Vibrio thalassae]SNX50299.1 hypothetical protein VTH8203_03954 [Vibrio thalassae]
MSESSFTSNTRYRFISKSNSSFKVRIQTLEGKVLHRSLGFIRLGEEKALEKAVQLRDELGVEIWGQFWFRLLSEPYILKRLPKSVEPKIIHKPKPTKDDPNNRYSCYIAKWREYNMTGEYKNKTMVRSINKYGKLTAYLETKKALLDAYQDRLDLLSFKGRLE